MPQNRTITVDYGRTTEVLYVVGTQLTINLYRTAPSSASSFSVVCSDNVESKLPKILQLDNDVPLNDESVLLLSMCSASQKLRDGKVTIQLYDDESKELTSAELLLTAFKISLDVDADQDGVVEQNNPNKASWKWGPDGHGAILLVNCDSDFGKKPDNEQNYIAVEDDLMDMSQMVLRIAGPEELPEGHRLMLHMSATDAEKARVYNDFKLVLDGRFRSNGIKYTKETTFYVEGVKFADKDFAGLVRIHISLLQSGTPETPIFTDTVQFKMAPWIMTPNVQAPLKVYVCSTPDNTKFIDGMKKLVQKVGCKLHVIRTQVNRGGDRWIQDEMELGYIQAPHQSFPVVLDSPRNRQLDFFPYNELLGPDFGYVTKEPPREEVTSLESFGNLDVSPPVVVNGKNYPLGRIIFGGAFPFQTDGRNMTSIIRNFLCAQVVQEPIVLFTDWLSVGHVDEFLSFVPAKDRKGFRLLLASPHAAYKLFQGLQEAGHGQAKFFEDVPVTKVTVDELLADKSLHDANDFYQRCIDWNRDCLKNELGLDEEDIVDLPVLFKTVEVKQFASGREKGGAVAYYPGIVNMVVLGKDLGIPKPYGPKVNGQCAIEQEATRLLENLDLKCNFIDDFTPYHLRDGEVHCGSNVRRKAFDFKWWEMDV